MIESCMSSFVFMGMRLLDARNKCIGLLPEIYKRRIYSARGFASIYEFAAKLAGLSQEQVNRVLNLEKGLVDRPALHKALVSGEVSVNKLRKIVSIATIDNQEEVLARVKSLSVRAVETLVRDYKNIGDGHVTMQGTMFGEVAQVEGGEIRLDVEVRDELVAMQKRGVDVNELLKKFLENYREVLVLEKAKIAKDLPQKAGRYIPVAAKNVLRKEFGDRCSVPRCGRKFQEIHHLIPYALAKKHDPRLMVQLCSEHHQIAHSLNAKINNYRENYLRTMPERIGLESFDVAR